MIETEEAIIHSEADPEVTIFQEDCTEDKITVEIEVTVDSKELEVKPDHQLKDLKCSSRYKYKWFNYRQFSHFDKNVPRRTHIQAKCSIEKK